MHIKMLIAIGGLAAAALAPTAAFAGTSGGESPSFYADQAIVNGNYAEAERILQPVSYADANDPARLINIATVYAQTNRASEARAALARVQSLPDESLVLEGGATFSSHALAKAMLGRLPASR